MLGSFVAKAPTLYFPPPVPQLLLMDQQRGRNSGYTPVMTGGFVVSSRPPAKTWFFSQPSPWVNSSGHFPPLGPSGRGVIGGGSNKVGPGGNSVLTIRGA